MIVTDKKLPVGVDGFEKLIRNGYYYLDKTNFIRQPVEWHGKLIFSLVPEDLARR